MITNQSKENPQKSAGYGHQCLDLLYPSLKIPLIEGMHHASFPNLIEGRKEKKFSQQRSTSVVDEAIQIFGGYGYIAETVIEHYFRDIWAIGVELGTEEEQKDMIAERMLRPDSTKK